MLGCRISLSNVLLHMTCVSGVLVLYWTLYFGAVPVLLRTLKGFGLNAVLSLLVLSFLFIYLFFILSPQQVLTYIVVYTYSKIKSHKKPYKIFDFNSRDSTFYNAIEKHGDVSSMQLICRTKQRKQILPPKTERYEAKINK